MSSCKFSIILIIGLVIIAVSYIAFGNSETKDIADGKYEEVWETIGPHVQRFYDAENGVYCYQNPKSIGEFSCVSASR